ncbi:hemin-degrading factor [Cyclobacterium plantarum]|uniref:Hemin-degrading factor n=1 Tax=Cyclobacterium plantarum TaxID=2716263 RepID=A0ABX0HFA3_9BACT|nr:ChuX/HutX family heme-like substrate-binding protein [Cyclobacterium plantarum]NHE58715.1 hemin-degrading factor [Cyclobacterium plantarum]
METTLKYPSATALKDAWETLKANQPKTRIRDAAKILEVSELELLLTTENPAPIRLKDDWARILLSCRELGKVMALTRNDGCVLEHKGNFQKITIHGTAPSQIATVIGPIEQRVFLNKWKYGFAVTTETARGTMRSFQFFDQAGDAILKIYLQENSNQDAYDNMVATYRQKKESDPIQALPFEPQTYASAVDREAFAKDWENMKDTHDFFGMLRKYNVHRLDAIKWIGEKWAYPVDRLSSRKILEVASDEKMPIMIFAGNKGNIQIHQGKVRTIRQLGDWLNVMDPDFNMHMDETCIAEAWVVHKNTDDGLVSSLELFDKDGEMIAQLFGLRKPGLPQNERWKNLIDSL